MSTDTRLTYDRAMFYTVEIAHTVRLEYQHLSDALDVCRRLRAGRSDTDHTVNLVAWPGRSAAGGGQPIGIILDQWSYNAED